MTRIEPLNQAKMNCQYWIRRVLIFNFWHEIPHRSSASQAMQKSSCCILSSKLHIAKVIFLSVLYDQ